MDTQPKNQFLPFKHNLIISILLILVPTLVIISLVNYNLSKQNLLTYYDYMDSKTEQLLIDHLQHIERTTLEEGDSLRVTPEKMFFSDLQDFVNNFKQLNPSVEDVRLFNHQGKLLIGVETSADDRIKLIMTQIENSDQIQFIVTTNEHKNRIKYILVEPSNNQQGNENLLVELTYTLSFYADLLQRQLLINIAISLGIITLVIIVSLIVGNNISKPIQSIANDVEQIIAQDLNHRVTVNTNNELQIIGNSINTLVTSMIHHIEKIKEVEHDLREKERSTRSLIDALPDLIIRVSPDGKYLDFKGNIQGMQALAVPENLGRKNDVILPVKVAQQQQHYIDLAISTGKVQIYEQTLISEGMPQHNEIRIINWDNDEVLLIIRNVTERKQIDEDLRHYQLHLERLVKEQTAGLTAANQSLLQEIQEREIIGKALRESEQRYRQLFEDSPISLWEVDYSAIKTYCKTLARQNNFDFENYLAQNPQVTKHCVNLVRVIDVNFATLKLFGTENKNEFLDIIEHIFYNIVGMEFDQQIIAIGENKTNLSMEIESSTLVSKKRHLHLIWSVARGYEKSYAKIFLSITNITARKHTEQMLTRQNEYLAALHNITLALVSHLDLDSLLKNIIEQISQLLGTTHSFIYLVEPNRDVLELKIGRGIFDTIVGLELVKNEGVGGKVWQTEQPLVIDDYDQWAQRIPYIKANLIGSLIGVPLKYRSQTMGVIGLAYDASQTNMFGDEEVNILNRFAQLASIALENARLFEMERKTRKQVETLRTVSLALSVTRTQAETFHLILTELQKVVPYDSASIQELKQNHLEIIDFTDPQHADELIGMCFGLKDEKHPNYRVIRDRSPLIIKDVQKNYPSFQGQPHSIRAWLGVPLIIGNQLIGMITLDKKDPDFYTQEHAVLAQAFATQAAIAIENARLYSATREATATAEAANQAKSSFLASMSHELRTPLNAILGYAQILQEDISLDPTHLEGAEIIKRSGEHLLFLINDILDISRIEAGKMKLRPVELHLPSLIERISEVMTIQAAEKGIRFVFQPFDFIHNKPSEKLPHLIYGDKKRLWQVLVNLLGNAIKFTSEGQVTFKVGPMTQSVPSDSSLAVKLRFQVEDTGIGIAPEQVTAIFQPFQQVNTKQSKTDGTGLGLPISQHLVQMMDGTLKVESLPGKGSTFWFDLKLLTKIDTYERPVIVKKKQVVISPKILIVDDDKSNRFFLKTLISRHGFIVREAIDGNDGINKAVKFQPDIILTDIRMTDLDGLSMTRQIRQHPEIKDVIIIASSASTTEADEEESLAAGCNDFIGKPVNFKHLIKVLKQFLNITTPSQKAPPEILPKQPLVIPSSQIIDLLIDLTKRGDIQEIRDQVIALRKSDQKFIPFSDKIFKLAKNFRINDIEHFLESLV
ncbi:GAF domain-containing protein [Anaerolineales bacterium HSG6]|nr:GAF domain-containing protein [Anaerolineales bacterium HSG6]